MKVLRQLTYMAWWFLKARIFGCRKPLQSVVFVTGGCDSTCRHCTICTHKEEFFKKYDDIASDFDYCYNSGARLLDVEGVHLLRWHEDEHTPADIFRMARGKGFFSISTMVKAAEYEEWKRLNADVDVLWVSILGMSDCTQLDEANDVSLYMVVNSDNYTELDDVLSFVQNHDGIKQIAFNFHTPFPGTEQMALTSEQRGEVINKLISRKRSGYRIMNSVSGLRNMLTQKFTRRCWICNFVYCDGRRSPQCIDDMASGMCEKCGFSMAGEMNAVFAMKPDTILAGMGIRL